MAPFIFAAIYITYWKITGRQSNIVDSEKCGPLGVSSTQIKVFQYFRRGRFRSSLEMWSSRNWRYNNIKLNLIYNKKFIVIKWIRRKMTIFKKIEFHSLIWKFFLFCTKYTVSVVILTEINNVGTIKFVFCILNKFTILKNFFN